MSETPSTLPTVLLVEDDPSTALLLRTVLQKDGYAIQHCADGEAALQLLEIQPFDAVILDLMLPQLDGMQVLKRMRSNPAHLNTPVFILTAARLKLIEEQAALYRVKLYLEKTEIAKLQAGLRETLAEQPSLQANKLRMADPGLAENTAPPKSDPPSKLGRFFGRKP